MKEIRKKVLQAIDGIAEIDCKNDLEDIEFSEYFESIDYVKMLLKLEETFGIYFELSDLVIKRINTLNKVCEIIEMKCGKNNAKE